MRVRKALTGIIIILIAGFIILKFIKGRPEQVGAPALTFGKGKIGIIELKGIIYDSDEIVKDIKQFNDDSSIQAIVLRIDSPGGAVAPSQEIYREVEKLSQKKFVVASIGSLGASGAYYVACAANTIYANPGSITGSIGVIMEFVNMKELFKWAKIEPVVIKSGEFKDSGAPYRDMTETERKYLQELIDNVHAQFMNAVAQKRKLDIKDVKKIADGRIFTGEMAKNIGLVDMLGDFDDAVEFAAQSAGIAGKPQLVYPIRKKFKLFEKFMDNINQLIMSRTFHGRLLTLSYLMYF